LNYLALENILDKLPIAAIIIDDSERIVVMNSLAMSLFGEDLISRNFITAIRQPLVIDAIQQTLKDGQTRKTLYLHNKSNFRINYEVSCKLFEKQVVLFFEDKSSFETGEQMRSDFIANVSHELKTPLTSILGFIETLSSMTNDDTKTRDRFLSIIQREAQRMDRLVADLLSLSKVEASERMAPIEKLELVDLIRSTTKALSPIIELNKIEIEYDLKDLEIWVRGDDDQLRQVLINLIENAVKYGGSNKKVKISLSNVYYETLLQAEAVYISIRDLGHGIDPLLLPRLTERFYRVDDHRSRELGGTGLGLAIVKHIMNRHRGRLIIKSRPGEGSEFKIILPH